MITLVPDGGLCNRMRAIDSCIALSEEIKQPLTVYWMKNAMLNCGFHDLFEPIPPSVALIKDMNSRPLRTRNAKKLKYKFIRPVFNSFQRLYFDKVILIQDFLALNKKKFDFRLLQHYKNVLLESHLRFFHNDQQPMYRHFQPLQAIEQKIQDTTQYFSKDTIGVHIRRADNKHAIDHSPLELFIQVMQKEVELNPETNFFVATDSTSVKTSLIEIFADKIIIANDKAGERNTKDGMVDAMVDLYSLSRTKKVLGSHWSSFSHTAAHISGIEEIVVKKDIIQSIYDF